MNTETSDRGDSKSEGFAPYDYTDGRQKLDWQRAYPPEAVKCIRWEAFYLAIWSILYLAAVFYIIHESSGTLGISESPASPPKGSQDSIIFLACIGAWIGGSLGGFSFGIKWMYHTVAKKTWHEDRRLWRLFSPHLSGVVSLFMVLLAASGVFQMFDKALILRPIWTMSFSFLVGYFSDKALAKMAEVADTLFGVGAKKE